MKKNIIYILIAMLVMVASYRLVVNHNRISASKQNIDLGNVMSIDVFTARTVKLDNTASLIGTLAAYQQVDLAAETAGKIIHLNCEVGQVKEKGSVVAIIDDRLKQIALDQATSNATKAKRDLQRTENLYKGNTSSEQDLDNARNLAETSNGQYEQAKKELANTRVTTSIHGIITKRMVDMGAYVRVGDAVASIVDISRLKVKINASESIVYDLKPGMTATVTTTAYPGVTFIGKVTFVSPQSDDTHNYPVEIELPNSAKTPLKAGTFVTAHIPIPVSSNGIYIPREALVGSVEDAKVYVARERKAMLTPIVVGRQTEQYLEVLSGLQAGAEVVINGLINLSDGKQIKIINKK